MRIQGDYHVHSPFCPHGTTDPLKSYIENAIQQNLVEISFTEHAPLPENFNDPTPEKDCGMTLVQTDAYIKAVEELKAEYKKDIKIHIGLEVDYIEGYEEGTRNILNTYGPYLDDSILSVHLLKAPTSEYVCLDYSSDVFGEIAQLFGSVDHVYSKYYETIKRAILSDLGTYKPNRIGHLTLIEKFKKRYPAKKDYNSTISALLDLIKENSLSLDVNTAGLFKQECQSIYPPLPIIHIAKERGIHLYPGSDSHSAETVGRAFEQLKEI